jgi:hypothetical protein
MMGESDRARCAAVASQNDSVVIVEDDPLRDDVQDLLQAHLALTAANTPAGFSFALDVE